MRALLPYLALYKRHKWMLLLGIVLAIVTLLASIGLLTLSGWFRDYVYIPLGGSRKGRARTVFNKLLVFLATGLWHGTGWTFVLWGLWHGAFCGAETLLDRNKTLKTHWYGHVYTLLVVIFGFVLFRAESLPQALMLLRTMLSGFTPVDACRLALRFGASSACLPAFQYGSMRRRALMAAGGFLRHLTR